MRRAMLAAVAALSLSSVIPTIGWAQRGPSTDDIVRSLTPSTTTGPTRGIRVAPPAAPATSAPASAQAPSPPPAAASIDLTVPFAMGSAELTPQALRMLQNLGAALRNDALKPYRFRIEGHTDTVGSADYNRALSERRAAAVLEFLVVNYQVDRNRLEAVGEGEAALLVATPDQTPEPRNRRVHVVNIGN